MSAAPIRGIGRDELMAPTGAEAVGLGSVVPFLAFFVTRRGDKASPSCSQRRQPRVARLSALSSR